MSKSKKSEAAIKARKTTLSGKTTEELIDIILRKDKTEQKNSVSIQNLKNKIKDLESVLDAQERLKKEYSDEIDALTQDSNSKENVNKITVKALEESIEHYKNKYTRVKKFARNNLILSILLGIILIIMLVIIL